MTPATGLHGVTLAHVPGIGMAPKAARANPGKYRPVLHPNAHFMRRVITALSADWQPVNDIAKASDRRPDVTRDTLTKLRRNGLAETRRSEPSGLVLWRLTPAGEAEQQWHRRQG